MMSKKIEDQKRINDILLGPLERPALKWLAEHMPQWVTPDILTTVGVVASILTFAGYALVPVGKGFLWLASLGFVMNWFGDSLDGTLARHRHIERPRFGFYIDHAVDALSVVLIFIGLGLSGYVNLAVACLAAIGYLMVAILVFLKTYVTGVFEMTSAKIGPTEVRVLGILINTVVFFFGNPEVKLPLLGVVSIFSMVVGGLAILLMSYFVITAITESRKLALLDGKRLERRLERRREVEMRQIAKEKKQSG